MPVPPIFWTLLNSVKNKKLKIWDRKCKIWVFLKSNFEKPQSYMKSASTNW